jgi:hypothetical protein
LIVFLEYVQKSSSNRILLHVRFRTRLNELIKNTIVQDAANKDPAVKARKNSTSGILYTILNILTFQEHIYIWIIGRRKYTKYLLVFHFAT